MYCQFENEKKYGWNHTIRKWNNAIFMIARHAKSLVITELASNLNKLAYFEC